nr:D-2-hydroxyacid dehydrogenase [uncultured Holophaga sp.]
MQRLAVLHPHHARWVDALRKAEPRLEIRGWHPQAEDLDQAWLASCGALLAWQVPMGFLRHMPALRWVQNTGAGMDHLVAHPELHPDVVLTRADGQFGLRMSRYVAAHLLAEAQALDRLREAQSRACWDSHIQAEDLQGARALVLGFGRIGRQIGELLRLLGMEVTGLVRTPRADPDFPLKGTAELPDLLPGARLLVLAAPLTPETRGLVDRHLLAHGHGRLTLINVGRGPQVVIPDMLEALEQGRLGRAVLDVLPEEPLAQDSPLWKHPKVVITPHHAGPSTLAAVIPDILPNLRRYAEGRPLEGAVDRARGY